MPESNQVPLRVAIANHHAAVIDALVFVSAVAAVDCRPTESKAPPVLNPISTPVHDPALAVAVTVVLPIPANVQLIVPSEPVIAPLAVTHAIDTRDFTMMSSNRIAPV